MPSADEIPAWLKLRRRLMALQEGVGGTHAVVCALSGGVLCYGQPRRPLPESAAPESLATSQGPEALAREHKQLGGLLERVLGARPPGKDRPGTSFTVALADDEPFAFAQSFAGKYVLLVSFNGPFTPFPVAAKVRGALPAIEALTLKLPPTDGPGRGVMVLREG